MSWYFYNAPYDIDDPETCGLSLLEAGSVSDAFTLSSSILLVSPNPSWKPFNPSDTHAIEKGGTAVGYRRQLFKVRNKLLEPIYWDLSVSTPVVAATFVFSSTLTPLPRDWELVASALYEQVKPWTSEYSKAFEEAQEAGNVDDISAKIVIDNTTGRILFSPAPENAPRAYILSLFQSKSAKFIGDWASKFTQAVEIIKFDYSVYKQRHKLPDRPSDAIDYIPPPISQLTLVVHGIGQKLSCVMEKRNFTFAVEKLRTRVRRAQAINADEACVAASKNTNVEPDSNDRHLPASTLMLPVIWRHAFKVENNHVSIEQIRPPYMVELREKFNDFLYDVPYYMSAHRDTMINAAVGESNRIFQLFKQNHPEFNGPIHMIGHSLGSVIAADILSRQPTDCHDGNLLAFNVSNFYTCGSPLGFFLYLRNSQLIPRSQLGDAELPEFGCLAVDQIYNVVHPYDFVATLLSPTARGGSEGLAPAILPRTYGKRPRRRFEIITSRFVKATNEKELYDASDDMLALNPHGQLDWVIKSSLGFELMGALTAHTDYWLNQDFAELLVKTGGGERIEELRARSK